MEDDAAHIHGVAEQLADDGKDVIIVCNSYGGIPSTQAAKVNVDESLYGSLSAGAGTGAGAGAGIPDYLKVSGEYMQLDPEGSSEVTFSDLPKEDALKWARRMPEHATNAFGGVLTSQSHYNIPITCVVCTEDRVIPVTQQRMIEDAKKVTQITVDVIETSTGHCPMCGHPDKVVDAIEKAAGHA